MHLDKFAFNDYSKSNETGYACTHCNLYFSSVDVLLFTFEDTDEAGYYRMKISSKIPSLSVLSYYAFSLNADVNVKSPSFTFANSWTENRNKIRELVFEENIFSVDSILDFNHVYTVTFSSGIETLKTNCTSNLFSLKEIYFSKCVI